ncbi:hypothetical protein F7725_013597 [Dissostichus mawsoni]|uniref:Uncharacterized protein n=1 Tax=Dissostichus mawsoni TaxID=36200 RepID=A0A7J5Y4B1_DISMA|nr:hypothetical protein F7725_013597 [Dissostichus mawsoni]
MFSGMWIEDLSSQEHRVCGESRKPLRDAVSDSVDYFHPLVAEGLIRRRMVADSHSLKFKNTSAACAGEGIEDRTQVRARFLPLSEQSSLGGHNPTPDRGKGQLICLEVQREFGQFCQEILARKQRLTEEYAAVNDTLETSRGSISDTERTVAEMEAMVQNVSQYHAAIDGAGQKLTEKTERLALADRDLVQRADDHAEDLDRQANQLEE